jgi:hypothetical protein
MFPAVRYVGRQQMFTRARRRSRLAARPALVTAVVLGGLAMTVGGGGSASAVADGEPIIN